MSCPTCMEFRRLTAEKLAQIRAAAERVRNQVAAARARKASDGKP